MIKKVFKIPLALIQQDLHFLFQWRKRDPYKNYLGLLGGQMKPGENLKKALIREVFEESSLIVRDLQFIGIVNEFFYSKSALYNNKLYIYKTVTKGKIRPNTKEGDLIWVNRYEFRLFKDRFIPTDWLIVKKIIEGAFFNFEIKVFENDHKYSIILGC